MSRAIVPVFVPHMGCPEQCVFCNQFRITGHWQPPDAAALAALVKDWQDSSGAAPELAFYGGSFTAIALSVQEALLEAAAALKRSGAVSGIRLSTRPDALGAEVLERLAHYGVDTVEIGVQSLDDAVLTASRRGHSAAQAEDALRRVKAAGFHCGAQMMVALPGDSPEKSLATGQRLAALAPDFVRIYPTAVIRETPLAEAYLQGDYVPWQREQMLDTLADLLEVFAEAQIPVIRVGLQAEDGLSQGDVIAGAYHPALGELARARRYRRRMAALLQKEEKAPVQFAVAPRCLSQAIGQHRENVIYLAERCGQPVSVVADASLDENTVERM